jgi:hypothetical protein
MQRRMPDVGTSFPLFHSSTVAAVAAYLHPGPHPAFLQHSKPSDHFFLPTSGKKWFNFRKLMIVTKLKRFLHFF